ncbi:unnamed protein product [Prorocentrum cordatum]|uniref:Uncharacterized protein n=1 Tax=Prorocentrum cordatum TaxID=2364126 RepID=A0ABN9S2J0_9DINO|nr:unnamed protein product [Polarella glacialis]
MPGAGEASQRRAQQLCVLGAASALYVLAWAAASGIFQSDQAPSFDVERFLRGANRQLRMNDLDMLHDSSWPWSSWDILRNLARARSGRSFLSQPARIGCCFGREARQLSIPASWPPVGAGQAAAEAASRLAPGPAVFWTSMHFVAFLDPLAVLREAPTWLGQPVTIKSHCLTSPTYCGFAPGSAGGLCSSDERFRRLMHYEQLDKHVGRQWGGVQAFNEDRFEEARRQFRAELWPELRREGVALFMCGHPLFWCRLFEGLGDAGVLGLIDEPHTLFLPSSLHDSWTSQLRELFAAPRWLLVAWAPFHALQTRWALGIRVAYVRAMALHEPAVGAYAPETRPQEVLVAPIPQRPVVHLLLHAASLVQPRDAGGAIHLRRWPQDLECGARCPKALLAGFRCAVLWPYDVFTMKLAELYAVGLPLFVQGDF